MPTDAAPTCVAYDDTRTACIIGTAVVRLPVADGLVNRLAGAGRFLRWIHCGCSAARPSRRAASLPSIRRLFSRR